jgi:hypothetical protein
MECDDSFLNDSNVFLTQHCASLTLLRTLYIMALVLTLGTALLGLVGIIQQWIANEKFTGQIGCSILVSSVMTAMGNE